MQTTTHLVTPAENGDANAMFEIGYRMAFSKAWKNIRPWKQAFAFWKMAAAKGHVRAMFYLGTCYDFSQGVRKNLPQAFMWYMAAAKQGHRDAQYNIGFFYREGEVVKKNYKTMFYWFYQALIWD